MLDEAQRDQRERSARGIAALSAWAAGLRWDDIPHAARHAMARILADDMASMLAARDEPELAAAHAALLRDSRAPEATLMRAGGPKVDLRLAMTGNGLAAAWTETDSGYSKAPSHPGLCSLPALLAVAECDGLSARELLRAATVAYEVVARLAGCWGSVVPPVHPHGLFNAPGAATAIAMARGFDAYRLQLALTAAVTMISPGPYSHADDGALVRNAWPAAGAQSGLLACELAGSGMGGIAEGPWDVYAGLLHAKTREQALTDALGTRWAVTEGYHKRHGCCQVAHAALDAMESLLQAHPGLRGGEGVASIKVDLPADGMHMAERHPANGLAARFSVPHAIAAMLVNGDAGVAGFGPAALADDRITRLREQVALADWGALKPWPLHRPGRVTITLRDGTVLSDERESARGGADQPLGDDELLAKCEGLAGDAAPGLRTTVQALMHAIAKDEAALDVPWRDWMRRLFLAPASPARSDQTG